MGLRWLSVIYMDLIATIKLSKVCKISMLISALLLIFWHLQDLTRFCITKNFFEYTSYQHV